MSTNKVGSDVKSSLSTVGLRPDPLGCLYQKAFGQHGVWLRRQRRAVASGGNAIGEAIDLLLYLVKRPESALNSPDLVGVRRAKHAKLASLEKLDAHAKQPDA